MFPHLKNNFKLGVMNNFHLNYIITASAAKWWSNIILNAVQKLWTNFSHIIHPSVMMTSSLRTSPASGWLALKTRRRRMRNRWTHPNPTTDKGVGHRGRCCCFLLLFVVWRWQRLPVGPNHSLDTLQTLGGGVFVCLFMSVLSLRPAGCRIPQPRVVRPRLGRELLAGAAATAGSMPLFVLRITIRDRSRLDLCWD